MTYYRVRKEFDQKRKNSRNCDILVANELYTENERRQLGFTDEAFEKIEIPKNQTYWFFGARFQKTESKWTKINGGNSAL